LPLLERELELFCCVAPFELFLLVLCEALFLLFSLRTVLDVRVFELFGFLSVEFLLTFTLVLEFTERVSLVGEVVLTLSLLLVLLP
jgi:hypothetical protein